MPVCEALVTVTTTTILVLYEIYRRQCLVEEVKVLLDGLGG